MVTERTIINALIIGASLILVPLIISSSLTVNYLPVLLFGGLLALVIAFFFLKDTLCVWPLLGISISGALNFLPLPLTASHIFCILVILYYITGYVIIRQQRIGLGKNIFLWPIVIIILIVFYHNHDLNVHALGSGGETEGSKPAILMYLGVLGYFCAINVSSPSVAFLSKVPLYSVILAILSSIPYILSTFIPSLTPYLYYITNSINTDAYLSTIAGGASESQALIGRLGGFGPLAGTIQVYLLCHYPIGTWLRPGRWWVAGLSLLCLGLVLATGFRNILFGFAILTMVGAWSYYSWRSLLLPMTFFIVLLLSELILSNHLMGISEDKVPLIAQRTLSFLPGDWDKEVTTSADSSNDFRQNIQDVYVKEYLNKSPLFGNGFSINTKSYQDLNYALHNNPGNEVRYLLG